MENSKALEKVVFDIALPSPMVEGMRRSKDTGSTFPVSLKNEGLVSELFSRITADGQLAVEFEVPEAIKTGLETGQYLRKGEMIVTSDGQQVVHWLQEGQVVRRVGMAVNVLSFFLDVLNQILLNNKLKQIQDQLDKTEDYLKAVHYSTFLNAHSSFKAALKATGSRYQVKLFQEARRYFQEARNKSFVLFREKGQKVHKDFLSFDDSWIDNKRELSAIYDTLGEMADLTDRISHSYKAEARICEALGEIPSAEDLHNEALNFQASSFEFIDWFLNGEKNYSDLEFVQSEIIGSGYQGRHSGKIHERVEGWEHRALFPVRIPWEVYRYVRRQTDQEGIPSWVQDIRNPISRKLEALKGQLALDVFHVTSTQQGSERLFLPDGQGVVFISRAPAGQ